MAFRQKVQHLLLEDIICSLMHVRFYNSELDWTKLRPMILEKIKNRTNGYPVRSVVPVAYDVLKSREFLTEAVSTLLKVFPVQSCKFCPEVYVGDTGHQIKTCHGFKRIVRNRVHRWMDGNVNDILIPLEASHLPNMLQDQRFDFHRIPAVVELCHQVGAKISAESSSHQNMTTNSSDKLQSLGQATLEAWETLRSGVQKLLLVSPAKVCVDCSEVHVGLSEYKTRLHEVFEHQRCKGSHRWKKAEVDDLVPLKMVWHRRPQDPAVLVDSGRGFYGRAPAVVELCVQAGARVPAKYCCMMKLLGLTAS